MRLVILGATGGTGIALLRRSITSNHSVTAFVRNPEALKEFRDHVEVRTGDLLNQADLARVLRDQDAVLSGFGPRVPVAKSDAHLLRDFAMALTGAMQQSGVRRLVIISTAFLFKDSILPPTFLLGQLLFPSVVKDSADMESMIQESSSDWTIVRPPRLTDSPFTGHYRERIDHLPRFGFKISRADVADYFIKSLTNQSLTRRIVGISN
jgi:putative NADH-flavin reductase